MYSRKSVGPRMDSLGIPALIGYSYEDFPSRTTPSRLLPRKDEIRPNIKLKFFRKSSMPNPVKCIGYIKWYSSGNPRPMKSPSYSIRYNCQTFS